MNFLVSFFYAYPVGSCWVWIYVVGGSYKVLRIGRSKNGYKKFKKTLTLRDRIFKRRFVELSKRCKNYQKYFVGMTYIFYFLVLIFLIGALISKYMGNFKDFLNIYLLVKCYLIELPAGIFTVFNLGRPKSKVGIEWKFVEQYKKLY